MAYSIQAFITEFQNSNLLKMDIPIVSLEQNLIMVPVNKVVREKFHISTLPLLEEKDNENSAISYFGCSISKGVKVAYIEAEFFGGVGMQASIVFDNEKIISEPQVSKNAINLALQYLGVSRLNFFDEFDALGLGKYRNTEEWVINA